MSDEVAKKFEEEFKGLAEPVQGRSITLTITLHPNGQLEMSGPLGNKVLANGLLGAGIQELHRIHLLKEIDQMAKSANGGGIAGLLKKMGRG